MVSVGVVAAGLVAPVPKAYAVEVTPQVRLTANSIVNIPANLFNTIASLPANEILAINQLTDSLNYSGNWFTWNPRHVEGFDYPDSLKVVALVKVLLPFPAVAESVAQQLNGFLIAEFPMNEGCTGLPGPCDDPGAWLGGLLQVPLSQLLAGYKLGTITNPITWPDGTTDPVPWSNTTIKVDPLDPLRAGWDSLTATPSGITTVELNTVLTTVPKLVDALVVSFNPLHPGSVFYGPPYPRPLDSTNFTWFDAIRDAVVGDDNADVDATLRPSVAAADEKSVKRVVGLTDPERPDATLDAREQDQGVDFGLAGIAAAGHPASLDSVQHVGPDRSTRTAASDAGASPGRHRLGMPVQRIIDRITSTPSRGAGLSNADQAVKSSLTRRVKIGQSGANRDEDRADANQASAGGARSASLRHQAADKSE